MTQFALVSLVPHLLESLQDCASPELNTYAKGVSRATNLRTSERSSCKTTILFHDASTNILLVLAYIGLPLQIFGEVSMLNQVNVVLTCASRALSFHHTHRYNNLIPFQLQSHSPTSPAVQTHCSCLSEILSMIQNLKIATAISLLTLTKPPLPRK